MELHLHSPLWQWVVLGAAAAVMVFVFAVEFVHWLGRNR